MATWKADLLDRATVIPHDLSDANFWRGMGELNPTPMDRRSSMLAITPMPRLCIPPTGVEPAVPGSTARCDTITPRWDSYYCVSYGTPSRIRTYVFWFKARCPWPLDDGGIFGGHRWDSNPQSSACNAAALPIELRAHWYLIWTAEGFEPPTLRMLTECSSMLSYAPILCLKDCRGKRTHLLKGHNRLCVAITLCSPY